MDEDRIRKELRSKLVDHETPIDFERIWAGIDQAQNEQRQNRPWWLFLFVGLVCMVSVAAIYINNQDATEESPQPTSDVLDAKPSKVYDANQNESQDLRVTKIQAVSSKKVQEPRKKDIQEARKNEIQKLGKKENILADQKNNVTSFSNESTIAKNDKPRRGQSIDRKIINAVGSESREIKVQKSTAPMTSNNVRNTSIDGSEEWDAIVLENKHLVLSQATTENQENTKYILGEKDVLVNHELPAFMNIPSLTARLEIENTAAPFHSKMMLAKGTFVPEEEAVLQSNNSWSWSGEIYMGVFKNIKEISAIDSLEAYQSERQATETPLETFSIGSKIKAVSPSGFLVYSGVEFLQITEKFEFSKNLNMTPAANFQSEVSVRNIDKRIYNKLSLVEIPIGIGYTRAYGKWGIELSGGINYNIILKAKGQLLSQELLPEDIADLDLYKNRVGLSYAGMLGIAYRWTDNVQSSLGINYKHYGASFVKASSGLAERHKFIGLQSGLSYMF